MKVELRYLDRKTGEQYLDGTAILGRRIAIVDRREHVLQYRYEYDPPHSPYPQKWWTDWLDIPVVKEEDL